MVADLLADRFAGLSIVELLDAELYALCDSSESKVLELAASLKRCSPACMKIEELLHSVDLVIESASQNAVRFIVPRALEAGCDVMILSVGALADEELRKGSLDLHSRITASSISLRVPLLVSMG